MPVPRWPAIFYCLLSWAGAFYHLILFSFLRRDIEGAIGLSDVALAWIDGLTFAAAAAGGIILGRVADLGGRRLVLALAPALPALGSWLLASSGDAASVTLARTIVGFGVGGGWGVGHALLAELYEGRKRLRAAAILQTGGPVAVVLAAFATCILIPPGPDGWRTVLAWSAVTALIAALDPWAMRSAGPWTAGFSRPRPDSLRSAGPWTACFSRPRPDSLRSAGPWTACFSRPRPDSLRSAGLRPASSGDPPASPAENTSWMPPAFGIFGLLALQMTAYWCTFAWLPSHLLEQGAARRTVGWIQMATGATQGVADLAFGWLSPRVGVRRLFAACNVAFGGGVLVLALAFPAIAGNPLALTATICAVGLGSGSWAAFGPLYAEHVPARIRSSVSSLSYHLARATQLAFQPAVAMIGTLTSSPRGAPLVVAALAAWTGALAIRGLRNDAGLRQACSSRRR